MSASQLIVVDYRASTDEVNVMLGVKGHKRWISVLCWVRCLGHCDSPRKYKQPRTGEDCTTPSSDVLYAATAEHLGGSKPWFFSKSQLGLGALGSWKGSIERLSPNEEAIVLLKAERMSWEFNEPVSLKMGTNQVLLDPREHILISSLDPKGGLSFVPERCVYDENHDASELFTGILFKTKFDRTHRLITQIIPEEFK